MGIETLIAGMPGTVAQGIIYGIMALGIFITFKLLNFADLSVDGSFATGGAVAAMVIVSGKSWVLALVLAFVAGASVDTTSVGVTSGAFVVLLFVTTQVVPIEDLVIE